MLDRMLYGLAERAGLTEAARRGARFVDEIERVLAGSLEEIRAFQLERLRIVCAHAARTTRLYRDRFAEAGIERPEALGWDDLDRLPVLTKDDIRGRLDDLLSDRFDRERLRASATGGTTASPTPIFMDWESYDRRLGATAAFDRWVGYRPGRRIAYLWGATQDFPRPRLRSLWISPAILERKLFLPASPLDDATMFRYHRRLARFAPVLLQAYPAPLEIFADFLLRKGLRLSIPHLSCTAEPLLDHQARTIERAFGVAPHNWYGTREAGRVAMDCERHSGMHLNAYGLHAETRGPAGEPGSLILTDLWNMAMPMIRYEIGDLGRIDASPCACGRRLPRLVEISGRLTDVFVSSTGRKVPGVTLTNRVIHDCAQIREMQILQHDLGRFEVLFVPGAGYAEGDERTIADKLETFLQEPLEVAFRRVEALPREPSGKIRFCKNLMPDA